MVDVGKIKQGEWSYPVVEMFLGKRDVDATVAATTSDDQKCEAQFYGGEYNLLHKDNRRADTWLKAAVESCPSGFIEFSGATAELKRLGP